MHQSGFYILTPIFVFNVDGEAVVRELSGVPSLGDLYTSDGSFYRVGWIVTITMKSALYLLGDARISHA